jgi:hypothetical protein
LLHITTNFCDVSSLEAFNNETSVHGKISPHQPEGRCNWLSGFRRRVKSFIVGVQFEKEELHIRLKAIVMVAF